MKSVLKTHGTGKLIYLTVLALLLFTILFVPQSRVHSLVEDLVYQGFVSDDDTVQRYKEQWWNCVDKSLRVGDICGNYKGYGTGLRFTGVNIPAGATIKEASITVTSCPQNYYLPGSRFYITAESAHNSQRITSYDDHVNRIRTSAYVYWSNLPAWYPGEKYKTLDFAKVIQEVVNKNAGIEGALTVFLEDPYYDCPDGRWKEFASLENGTYDPASIKIVYIVNGSKPSSLAVTIAVNGANSTINQDFNLTVTGPSYPSGKQIVFHLVNGLLEPPTTVTLNSLLPGTYTVNANNLNSVWIVSGTGDIAIGPDQAVTRTIVYTYVPPSGIKLRVYSVGYQDGYVKIELEFAEYPLLSHYVLAVPYPVSAASVQEAITASSNKIREQFNKSLEAYSKLQELGFLNTGFMISAQ